MILPVIGAILLDLTSLAVAIMVARRFQRAWTALIVGVLAGLATRFGLAFAGGFLSYVVPINQFEFWLAGMPGLRHLIPAN